LFEKKKKKKEKREQRIYSCRFKTKDDGENMCAAGLTATAAAAFASFNKTDP